MFKGTVLFYSFETFFSLFNDEQKLFYEDGSK